MTYDIRNTNKRLEVAVLDLSGTLEDVLGRVEKLAGKARELAGTAFGSVSLSR